MNTFIDRVAPNTYRISVQPSQSKLIFNQFLIKSDKPTLIHSGLVKHFEHTHAALSSIINPEDLQYVCASHIESDETGALNKWLEVAPNARACVGRLAANTLRDFALRPPSVVADGQVVNIGKGQRLRLLETPHVPHGWEACLFFDESTGVLFGSDLGTQLGSFSTFRDGDVSAEIIQTISEIGYMSFGPHLEDALDKISSLPVSCLAVMHGSSLRSEQFRSLILALRAHMSRKDSGYINRAPLNKIAG